MVALGWMERWGEGENTKGNQETFGGDGCICYLDCGDGFKDYICQNLSNFTLYICGFMFLVCMSILPK